MFFALIVINFIWKLNRYKFIITDIIEPIKTVLFVIYCIFKLIAITIWNYIKIKYKYNIVKWIYYNSIPI